MHGSDRLDDFLNDLAEVAGANARRHFRKSHNLAYKGDTTPVTQADREIETALRRMIYEAFPDDSIIGEEFDTHKGDSAHTWVIDPIDGTKAFATGRATFATLIARCRDGVPETGMIDQPVMEDRWLSVDGKTSYFNGELCKTTGCERLDEARLHITSPVQMLKATSGTQLEQLKQACALCIYQGDSYAYGLLASGHLDVCLETGLAPHDFLAAVPIVHGAGGAISDWAGRDLYIESGGDVIAASTPALHHQTSRFLRSF
jgi:histidinol phosphatase-like enzyme (inositol monophosphatase family)